MRKTNGNEETRRTNKERTSKLSVLYIIAAFLLSFGLMFTAGSVTSFAEGNEPTNENENDNGHENDDNDDDGDDDGTSGGNQSGDNTITTPPAKTPEQIAEEQAAAEAARLAEEAAVRKAMEEEAARKAAEEAAAAEAARLAAEEEARRAAEEAGQVPAQQPEPQPAPKITVAINSTDGATVSDGAQGTGRLAGYTTEVNHITSSTGDEITTIFLNTNNGSDIALTTDDFDFSGLDPQLYEVQYDLDCGMIYVIKKNTATNTNTSTSTTTTSSTKTTVYYQFTEVTSIEAGKEYYFVPYTYDKLDGKNAVIGVPEGTARLNSVASKTTNTSTFGNDNEDASDELKYYHASTNNGAIKNNVNVEEKGRGFDGCKVGILYHITGLNSSSDYYQYNGLMGYWCHYGGAQAFRDNIFGRVYTYLKTEVTSDSLKATVKDGAFDSVGTGNVTITDKDIAKYLDVSLTIGNSDYTIGGCTVVDGTLNYRGGDNEISIKFGDTTKVIKVDLSNLAKLVWQEDNESVRGKKYVSNNDIEALQRAIAEGLANSGVSANDAEMAALSAKLAAAVWQENNKEALAADANDTFNYELITNASKKYDTTVNANVKQYMNVSLTAKQALVEKKVNEEADKFIADRLKYNGDAAPFGDATADNTDQILATKADYDKLSPAVKLFLDSKYTVANRGTENAAVTYAEILERAQNLKDTADAFVAEYASILVSNEEDATEERVTYDKTSRSNYAQIIKGAKAWNNLTEEERRYINKALNLGNGDNSAEGGVLTNQITFEKLLADAYAIRASLNKEEYVPHDDSITELAILPVVAKKEEKAEEAVENRPVRTKTNSAAETEIKPTNNKGIDDIKARIENANALDSIYNLVKEEAEKVTLDRESLLELLENTISEIASTITETAKQTFGNGTILINVESWLSNSESGEGMWTNSSAKNKHLSANESQVSYSLENADRLAAACLTASELNAVNNGDTMEIRLRINPNESQVSEEHKVQFNESLAQIQDSFVGLTKGEYIDISLEKRHNAGSWEYIPEVGDAVRIAIDVPEGLVQSGRTFFIIRNHDGECTILRDLDDSDDTLTIETDRFSDYLIIYDDNFAESAKNAASGTLFGTTAGTTASTAAETSNVVVYVIAFFSFLFMAVVVADMRKKEEEC